MTLGKLKFGFGNGLFCTVPHQVVLSHFRRRPSCALRYPISSNSYAFSLVEVVIAIGIASFCLVTMMGLIPVGVKSVRSTTSQTIASQLLEAISLDLRSTPLGSNSSPSYAVTLPASGTASCATSMTLYLDENGGTNASSLNLNSQYRATLYLSNSSIFSTTAQIQITWPASVAPSNAIGSLETITTIIRQ